MEKKKLLLVAISVGVFLVLTIGAAILVFTPKNTNLPFETVASNYSLEPVTFIPQSTYQPPIATGEQETTQQSSIEAIDLVRNPGSVPGLVTPPEGANGTGNVINVTQPTTAAVPSTAPTGRAANQSAPAAVRPAQTTTTPAQTTTTPSQTTTTPTQTTAAPPQTTTTPAQTTATPPQTTTTPAQTASMPAQTTPAAPTVSQAAQARIYDDYWVQTGAFSTIATAEEVKETLASKGIISIVENGNVNGRTLFRVRVGPYASQNEANYWLALIKSIDGFEDSQVRQTQNLR